MGASVTFSEATAPVKLPTRHCPPVLLRLEPKTAKGGISRVTPPRLASQLLSLPPILHMTVPSPIPGYSKAPRGLFVLPRVARVFTGTVISPSPPSRQWPSRSTIHAGRNLPDKGLRYLRHVVTPPVTDESVSGVGRSFLPTSACRHTDRTISSHWFRQGSGVWSLRIPRRSTPVLGRPGASSPRSFLLIVRTGRIVTC